MGSLFAAGLVSTHSRLKAAGYQVGNSCHPTRVSTHSRLKAAGGGNGNGQAQKGVSTHSRLKAAGATCTSALNQSAGFNTQPPEGGWRSMVIFRPRAVGFQHTAA